MEIFLPIVVLVFLVILMSQLGEVKRLLRSVQDELEAMRREIAKRSTDAVKPEEKKYTGSFTRVKEEEPGPKESLKEDIILTPEPKKQEEEKGAYVEKVVEPPAFISVFDRPVESPYEAPAPEPVPPKNPSFNYAEPAPSWWDKWLKENPDMEKFIGENLINKIGIGILVLGVGFFVKYAIDQDWIKEIGRVCIGLFCGAVLLALAHRLRKNYHSFSSVLVGGGLTIFYFTIALAFHQYQLFSQDIAFVIMVVITVFAVLLSILYDRIELAIIASVGGFIAPFLVSNGEGNYVVLFTYLSILNAGLIVLAYYKRWRPLNFISFFFTAVIFAGWIVNGRTYNTFSYKGTFIFDCVFYAMFVVMNVIHHVSRGSKLKAFDLIVLLSVNLFFYGEGVYLLTNGNMGEYKGLFTAVLGAVNLILGYAFFKRSKADKNFIYLLIGITVTYISLAAPVQLNGHYITLFWAAETVVLLWLYQKSFIRLFKVSCILVTGLMLISLAMDWMQVYSGIYDTAAVQFLPVIINKGFITGLVCSLAMFIVYRLLRREADTYYLPGITNAGMRSFYITVFILLLFCTGTLEINFQFSNNLPGTGIQFLYLQLYVVSFFVVLFFVFNKLRVATDRTVRIGIPLAVFAAYVLNVANTYVTEKQMLASGSNKMHFIANVFSVVLLLTLIANTISYVRKNKIFAGNGSGSFAWVVTIAILVVFSLETRHLFVWLYYSGASSVEYAENLYSKAGLSIVWGLSSFVIIWLGLSKKYKPLRVIALVVFGITLVKLFAYDIQNIPVGGKILAFILLGVVLLVVSFMYQRLKKLIIDDKNNVS